MIRFPVVFPLIHRVCQVCPDVCGGDVYRLDGVGVRIVALSCGAPAENSMHDGYLSV